MKKNKPLANNVIASPVRCGLDGKLLYKNNRRKGVMIPVDPKKTIHRNDPCPCRSGKKWKNCCRKKS